LEDTTTISCPYCNSDTLVILDGTDGELDLVSDCENCCRPIVVITNPMGLHFNSSPSTQASGS